MRTPIFALALGLFLMPSIPAAAIHPPAVNSPTIYDNETLIDGNNISMFVTNHGSFAYNITAIDAGFEFPKGSGKHCVYAAGLWIGAKVGDEVRVTAGDWGGMEYQPGVILPAADPPWDDPDAPQYKVYKIVEGDTTSSDYLNWPAWSGAPVGAGGRPLLRGTQTLWCVYNEANPRWHWDYSGCTAPLGVEIQQTAFAYGWTVAFGNVVFMEFKIINKLTETLDSTYLCVWADPDIGGGFDDYVGCDSVLSLGFAYNADNSDAIYGSQPPCVGFDLLKGPEDDSGSPLGMTSFCRYINGTDPDSAVQSYNYIRGFNRDGSPVINPTTGNTTTYAVSGDPVARTGWCDSDSNDVRMMISSGPFTMAPGDTQEIAIAIIAAEGRNRIASVHLMKEFDEAAQLAYDQGFVGQYLPHDVAAYGESAVKRDPTIPIEAGQESAAGPSDPLRSWVAYPNPASGSVRVQFSSETTRPSRLVILDTAGRTVRTLYPEDRSGTTNQMIWDGRDAGGDPVPPGVYFMSLDCGGRTETGKIILVR